LPLVRFVAVLLSVFGATVALGDTGDVVKFGSTIREAIDIYRYSPSVASRGGLSWASVEVRRMGDIARSPRRGPGLSDGFTHAFRHDPFRVQGYGGGLGGTSETSSGGSTESTGSGGFETGLGLASEVMDPDPGDLMAELPEEALAMADMLAAYTDGTRAFVLDLNGIVQSRMAIDWEKILQSIEIIKGEEADVEEKPQGKTKKAAKKALEQATAAAEKPSRSVIRITIGFIIGLGLWFVVRRL
jgi:hypothetical protein